MDTAKNVRFMVGSSGESLPVFKVGDGLRVGTEFQLIGEHPPEIYKVCWVPGGDRVWMKVTLETLP